MTSLQTDRPAGLRVREISGASVHALITLLASEGLPTDDVAEADRRFFAFSDANGSIVSYGGLERAGDDLLLRSVVTTAAHRGAEHGGTITEWLGFPDFHEAAGSPDLSAAPPDSDYPGALHSAHAPSHLEGDQEFADSPLEEARFELPVPPVSSSKFDPSRADLAKAFQAP
jgi:hypothetical protein